MRLPTFDVVVRLGGQLDTEVFKAGITAAEIEILQRVHGPDSIPRAKETGAIEQSAIELRAELDFKYTRTVVQAVLGASDHSRLPLRPRGLTQALAAGIGSGPVDIEKLREQIRAEVRAEIEGERRPQPLVFSRPAGGFDDADDGDPLPPTDEPLTDELAEGADC